MTTEARFVEPQARPLYDEAVYELTIQDSPVNIAMESLLWQEDLKRPAAVLGAERGFATNRGPARSSR